MFIGSFNLVFRLGDSAVVTCFESTGITNPCPRVCGESARVVPCRSVEACRGRGRPEAFSWLLLWSLACPWRSGQPWPLAEVFHFYLVRSQRLAAPWVFERRLFDPGRPDPQPAIGRRDWIAVVRWIAVGLAVGIQIQMAVAGNRIVDRSTLIPRIDSAVLGSVVLDSVVLDSVGLDSVGLDSVGLDSVGLDSVGLGSVGLGSVGLGSVGLGSVGLGSVGLGSVGLDSAGLDSAGLDSAAVVLPVLVLLSTDESSRRPVRCSHVRRHCRC